MYSTITLYRGKCVFGFLLFEEMVALAWALERVGGFARALETH